MPATLGTERASYLGTIAGRRRATDAIIRRLEKAPPLTPEQRQQIVDAATRMPLADIKPSSK